MGSVLSGGFRASKDGKKKSIKKYISNLGLRIDERIWSSISKGLNVLLSNESLSPCKPIHFTFPSFLKHLFPRLTSHVFLPITITSCALGPCSAPLSHSIVHAKFLALDTPPLLSLVFVLNLSYHLFSLPHQFLFLVACYATL